MDSLVGYGSDDDGEYGRNAYQLSGGGGNSARRKEDDTNYDDVNMDMSEESQGAESEPELPQAVPPPVTQPSSDERRESNDNGSRSRSRSSDRRDRRRDNDRDRERHRERGPHRDRDRERNERERHGRAPRRAPPLPDRNDERDVPRPSSSGRGADSRDAVSPRFVEQRERRDRDRERDRDRDNRHRRSEERRTGEPGDYRPSSYKVNKKLEVMEKMGLQIKTPDGSMATAKQLRAATQPYTIQSHRALDQVQKRKLLWSNKQAGAAEAEAAKWSGARFAQDSDGKQVSKFMRLMGIKDPAAVKTETVDATQDPNKKQEELFQAMQAQYEVARATTHTMRGVGLGFQRGNF